MIRTAFVLALTAPLAAQIPAGWTYRTDAAQSLVDEDQLQAGQWRYTRMPPGWHVTTTDQGATLLASEHRLSGRWGIEVELFLFPNPSDAPLGIVMEAADAPAGSMQLRFLMRRDGMAALIARHEGTDTLLMPWRRDSLVGAHGGGVEKYVLRVNHEPDHIAFSVNGREMLWLPTGGEDHVVIPGLRVGPALNVHVSRFDLVTPMAPARARRSPGG